MRLRFVRGLILGVVLAAILATPGSLLSHSSSNAAAYSAISIVFDHPEFGATGQTIQCTVTMDGGPAADLGGTYNWSAEISGSTNSTGASIIPSIGSPMASGVWVVNVTMPGEGPQKVTVAIVGTSTAGTSGAKVTVTSEFEMQVVVPVLIEATVTNTGQVDANNVTARIFADGVLLYTRILNVTAGSTATLSYNWSFLKIKSGRHVITVTVDDPNNVVEFSNGNNVFSQVVYIGTPGNPAGVAITIGIIIAAVLVVLMWLQKPLRRQQKKL